MSAVCGAPQPAQPDGAPLRRKALDAITILKSGTGRASKRIVAQPDGAVTIEGFNAGRDFKVFEAPVSDIASLSAMPKVAELPDCLVIRGEPRRELNLDQLQRRQKKNFCTSLKGRQHLLIDFDKIPLPSDLSLREDAARVREYLISLLPAEFHQAPYHWQLSSSAGIGDPSIVSMHLWFWLDRPVTDAQLKAWSAHWNAQSGMKLIDPALFNDVQPHYTAAPTFVGMEDPFPVRSGLVRKLLDEVALKLPPPQTVPRPRKARSETTGLQPSHGFEAILGQIGDHAGGLGFHVPIIRAVASYVATHGSDDIDTETLYEVVRAHGSRPIDQSMTTLTRCARLRRRGRCSRGVRTASSKVRIPKTS